MSTTELVLNMLAETATKEISKVKQPNNFENNISVAKEGGKVAGNARKAIEEKTGKPIITSKKATEFGHVVTRMIETSSIMISKDNEP